MTIHEQAPIREQTAALLALAETIERARGTEHKTARQNTHHRFDDAKQYLAESGGFADAE